MKLHRIAASIVVLTAAGIEPAGAAEGGFFEPLAAFEESLPWPQASPLGWQLGGEAERTLARALALLSRGGSLDLSIAKPLTYLEQARYRARLDGGTLALADHPAGLRLRGTTRETIPEFWDERTGLSFFIMHVTTFAVAGSVTRWVGPRPVEQADFKILPSDLSRLTPLARILLERSGFGVGHAPRLLPIDARFSFLEKVPFWTRTPRRPHYLATVIFDGNPVAEIVVDNDARPGTILSVAPTALPWPEFERDVWSLFPYR